MREVVVDVDATLIAAHSDKQGAAPTNKRRFGFHPLLAYLDHGPGVPIGRQLAEAVSGPAQRSIGVPTQSCISAGAGTFGPRTPTSILVSPSTRGIAIVGPPRGRSVPMSSQV